MSKEPTVQVPVSIFLDLARLFKEEPQELVRKDSYLTVDFLEKKAYRKYQEYRKKLKVKP